MTPELASKLKQLAQKYEITSFVDADPSQFLRWYELGGSGGENRPHCEEVCPQAVTKVTSGELSPSCEVTKVTPGGPSPSAEIRVAQENRPQVVVDTEVAAFIAAMLSFGSRSQFIPKIRGILELADSRMAVAGQKYGICSWLTSGDYKTCFPTGSNKFYRFYSYDDMHTFFGEIAQILNSGKTFGDYVKEVWESDKSIPLDQVLGKLFPESAIVPKGKNSANKRIHMFLRWMVRQNSPVDLGLWTWYSPANLLIPLDVHVMQESIKLGLLPEKASASRKTAVTLSAQFSEIWPEDPCRGDFALFGLGVDDER